MTQQMELKSYVESKGLYFNPIMYDWHKKLTKVFEEKDELLSLSKAKSAVITFIFKENNCRYECFPVCYSKIFTCCQFNQNNQKIKDCNSIEVKTPCTCTSFPKIFNNNMRRIYPSINGSKQTYEISRKRTCFRKVL